MQENQFKKDSPFYDNVKAITFCTKRYIAGFLYAPPVVICCII